MKKLSHIALLYIPLILFFCESGFAAKVVKVKGTKIYLDMQDDVALNGDEYYLLDGAGKKKGLIKIIKTKEAKAIANKLKGKAVVGWTLLAKASKSTAKPMTSAKSNSSERSKKNSLVEDGSHGRTYWGFIVGMSLDKMDATIQFADETTKTTNMSGNGMNYKALFDYGLWQQIWFRGLLGIENFTVESSDTFCGTTNEAECFADISYFSLDLWGRYMLSQSTLRPWFGVGFSLMFPSSKKAEAINENSVTSTSVFAVGGGLDWFVSPSIYIPIQLEYGMYPPSDDVKANYMSFRAGVGFSF